MGRKRDHSNVVALIKSKYPDLYGPGATKPQFKFLRELIAWYCKKEGLTLQEIVRPFDRDMKKKRMELMQLSYAEFNRYSITRLAKEFKRDRTTYMEDVGLRDLNQSRLLKGRVITYNICGEVLNEPVAREIHLSFSVSQSGLPASSIEPDHTTRLLSQAPAE